MTKAIRALSTIQCFLFSSDLDWSLVSALLASSAVRPFVIRVKGVVGKEGPSEGVNWFVPFVRSKFARRLAAAAAAASRNLEGT